MRNAIKKTKDEVRQAILDTVGIREVVRGKAVSKQVVAGQDVIDLNHYSNFQPLWASDNIRKGGWQRAIAA